ncbi:hypothetical protein WS105_0644 [Weissella ceti]|uniref:hypothetical protein n=1 Tax=Weissella ceti TaxID=759620 RepID=UPI0004F8F391|nr:hypothetical protein [Weissella ceti]AIM64234.1 hypothetical protein WS105_0644 [Weissella ceti]
MEGEKIGVLESAFLTFNEKKADGTAMPQFVLTRNIRTVQRLAWATGVELTEQDFEGLETLAPAFINAKGKYLVLKVAKTKSKKGDVYTNYDFDQAEQPADGFNEEIEISDDDVPF